MNQNEIEQLTLKILYAEKVISPPVDAERIAEISYDLEIDVLKLKNTDDLASIDFNHKKIILNEIHEDKFNKNLGLRNFTIAHEMRHWFLHKNLTQKNLFGENIISLLSPKIEIFTLTKKNFLKNRDNKNYSDSFFALKLDYL